MRFPKSSGGVCATRTTAKVFELSKLKKPQPRRKPKTTSGPRNFEKNCRMRGDRGVTRSVATEAPRCISVPKIASAPGRNGTGGAVGYARGLGWRLEVELAKEEE